jgi:hypothetical protein
MYAGGCVYAPQGAYTQVGAYTLYAVQADVRCVYTVGAYNKAYDWCV